MKEEIGLHLNQDGKGDYGTPRNNKGPDSAPFSFKGIQNESDDFAFKGIGCSQLADKVEENHQQQLKMLKISEYIFSQFGKQDFLLTQIKEACNDLQKENDLLTADQQDVDEILNRYQNHVDLMTKELKDKEIQCNQLLESNMNLEKIVRESTLSF